MKLILTSSVRREMRGLALPSCSAKDPCAPDSVVPCSWCICGHMLSPEGLYTLQVHNAASQNRRSWGLRQEGAMI